MEFTTTSPVSTLTDEEMRIHHHVREDVVEAIRLYEASNGYLHVLRKTVFTFDVCATELEQTKTHRQSSVQLDVDAQGVATLNARLSCMRQLARNIAITDARIVHDHGTPRIRYIVTITAPRPEVA